MDRRHCQKGRIRCMAEKYDVKTLCTSSQGVVATNVYLRGVHCHTSKRNGVKQKCEF
jgi:hypothetical protein